MPSATDCQQNAVVARVVHAFHDVGGIHTPDNRRRLLVDHSVVEFSTYIIVGVAWQNQVAT
jgi:hypothetical protein